MYDQNNIIGLCMFVNIYIYIGEWWNNDVEEVVKQGNTMGLPPNASDAHTINGKPGPLFPCSEKRNYISPNFSNEKI